MLSILLNRTLEATECCNNCKGNLDIDFSAISFVILHEISAYIYSHYLVLKIKAKDKLKA